MEDTSMHNGRGVFRPQAYLRSAVNALMNRAQESPQRREYLLVSAVILSAFRVEAGLNHVLAVRAKVRPEPDPAPYNWRDKIRFLAKDLEDPSTFNLGTSRLQTVMAAFEFRDYLAHARLEEFTFRSKGGALDEEIEALITEQMQLVRELAAVRELAKQCDEFVEAMFHAAKISTIDLYTISDGMVVGGESPHP